MTNKQQGGSGNFANDKERASEAGRKGAEVRQQHQQDQKSGQHGGMKSAEGAPQMGDRSSQGQQHQKEHSGTHQQGGASGRQETDKGSMGREGGKR